MVHRITLKQYLTNPVGKGSASVARRDAIRMNLEMRYLKLLKNAGKKFQLTPYITKNGEYYFWMKIPSEFYFDQNLVYDVVIKFNQPNPNRRNTDLTLSTYPINLFSNSPNFMFTYAYVYNKDGNLIGFLRNKLNPKSLTDEPVIRNPEQSYGFEKSVYFAILWIRDNPKFITKSLLNPKPFNPKEFQAGIVKSDTKLKEYNIAKKKDQEKLKKKSGVTNKFLKTSIEYGMYKKSSKNIKKKTFKPIVPKKKKLGPKPFKPKTFGKKTIHFGKKN